MYAHSKDPNETWVILLEKAYVSLTVCVSAARNINLALPSTHAATMHTAMPSYMAPMRTSLLVSSRSSSCTRWWSFATCDDQSLHGSCAPNAALTGWTDYGMRDLTGGATMKLKVLCPLPHLNPLLLQH